MGQSISTNTFGVAKWIVSADATQGTHTTIQGAITSASSGDTIFIRDGTYTENLTGKAGVILTALLGDSNEPNVTIVGNATFSAAGTFTISNIRLQTNSAAVLTCAGTAATIVNLNNCNLNFTNATGLNFSTANTSSRINLNSCIGDLGTTGIALFSSSATGGLTINYCEFTNSGGSTTASTASAGSLGIFASFLSNPIITSSTCVILFERSSFETTAQNVTSYTHNATAAGSAVVDSIFNSGSASAISIGAAATLTCAEISVISSNTNVITGSGTFQYGLVAGQQNTGAINASVVNTFRNFTGTLFSTGISFDAGSNTLANYAVGTFTPTMTGSTVAGATTYVTQSGLYTRIGRLVVCQINLVWSAATGTGNMTVGGLPFTINNTANYLAVSAIIPGFALTVANTIAYMQGNNNTITGVIGQSNPTTGGLAPVAIAAVGSIYTTFTYQI